jgi:GNAT superfamily N-acetyltransferase
MEKHALRNMSATDPSFHIRRAETSDAARLTQLARAAFFEAFRSNTTEEDLRIYMNANFRERIQLSEIADPASIVLLAHCAKHPVGFTHLYPSKTPFKGTRHRPLQLKRMYLLASCLGTGIGASLMQRSLSEASLAGYHLIWLSCWEQNGRALSFYRKWGFKPVGQRKFRVGCDVQQDVILSRKI